MSGNISVNVREFRGILRNPKKFPGIPRNFWEFQAIRGNVSKNSQEFTGIPSIRLQFPDKWKRILQANRMVEIPVIVIETCKMYGIHCSLENPMGSYLWRMPFLQKLRQQKNKHWFDMDCSYCRYGRPYRKNTRFMRSYKPLLACSKSATTSFT